MKGQARFFETYRSPFENFSLGQNTVLLWVKVHALPQALPVKRRVSLSRVVGGALSAKTVYPRTAFIRPGPLTLCMGYRGFRMSVRFGLRPVRQGKAPVFFAPWREQPENTLFFSSQAGGASLLRPEFGTAKCARSAAATPSQVIE